MPVFNKIFVEVKGKVTNIEDLNPDDYDSFLEQMHTLRKTRIEKLFSKDHKPGIIIKVYDPLDAPVESEYLYFRMERNGIIDLSVPTYKIPKAGEKKVFFYRKTQ